jgi:YfiH family protein
MIKSKALEKAGGLQHGFFTRQGGKSQGVFESLNCGYGSDEDSDIVSTNRAHAMELIGLDETSLVTAYQTHSADVVVVKNPWLPAAAPKVDGMVSNVPGIALGILTADCAPVLFSDPIAGVVGAAHAGWRGAKDGVLKATLEAMSTLGAKAHQVTAAIGPCIQQASYEVSDSFYDSFLIDNLSNEEFFCSSNRPGHKQFNLPGFIISALRQNSVENIESLNLDTYKNDDLFFSYRRATHRQEKQYGRLLSAIALEPR